MLDESDQVLIVETIDGTEIDISELSSILGIINTEPHVDVDDEDECLNCLQKFGPGSQSRGLIYSDCVDEAGIKSLLEINVSTALNYIFRWRSFGITFQRQNGDIIEFDENKTNLLCVKCVQVVEKLYSAIRDFDILTVLGSKINNLTNIYLETIIEFANSDKNSKPEKEISIPDTRNGTTTKFVPYKIKPSDVNTVQSKYTWEDMNVDVVGTQELSKIQFIHEVKENEVIHVPSKQRIRKKQEENISFICVKCEATFKKNKSLRRHLLTHEVGNEIKKYKCESCDRSFHFQYLLKNHAKIHLDVRLEVCDICDMRFKGKDGLFHHRRDVHKEESKRPKCNICKKTFKQERSLAEHKLMIHQLGKGTTIVPCTNCGAEFKRRRSMVAHLRLKQCFGKRGRKKDPSKHKDEETEKMKKKIFPIRNLSLDNNYAYSCPFKCGKLFSRKSSLSSHVKYLCPQKPKEEYEFEDEVENIPNKDVPVTQTSPSRVMSFTRKKSGRGPGRPPRIPILIDETKS